MTARSLLAAVLQGFGAWLLLLGLDDLVSHLAGSAEAAWLEVPGWSRVRASDLVRGSVGCLLGLVLLRYARRVAALLLAHNDGAAAGGGLLLAAVASVSVGVLGWSFELVALHALVPDDIHRNASGRRDTHGFHALMCGAAVLGLVVTQLVARWRLRSADADADTRGAEGRALGVLAIRTVGIAALAAAASDLLWRILFTVGDRIWGYGSGVSFPAWWIRTIVVGFVVGTGLLVASRRQAASPRTSDSPPSDGQSRLDAAILAKFVGLGLAYYALLRATAYGFLWLRSPDDTIRVAYPTLQGGTAVASRVALDVHAILVCMFVARRRRSTASTLFGDPPDEAGRAPHIDFGSGLALTGVGATFSFLALPHVVNRAFDDGFDFKAESLGMFVTYGSVMWAASLLVGLSLFVLGKMRVWRGGRLRGIAVELGAATALVWNVPLAYRMVRRGLFEREADPISAVHATLVLLIILASPLLMAWGFGCSERRTLRATDEVF